MIKHLRNPRLYFIAVTSLPAKVEQAQLRSAGLSLADAQAATTAIAAFRTAYDSLSNNYNQQVEAGNNPDLGLFMSTRDTLVANTCAALQKALSSSGMQSFNVHVQGEKTRMKTSGVTTTN